MKQIDLVWWGDAPSGRVGPATYNSVVNSAARQALRVGPNGGGFGVISLQVALDADPHAPYNRTVMIEILANLQGHFAAEWLLAIAAILILVDYFFPTDWPAHVGYVCVAVASFFFVWGAGIGEWHLSASVALAIGMWVSLAILHRLVFRQFLANAPGTERYVEERAEPQTNEVTE